MKKKVFFSKYSISIVILFFICTISTVLYLQKSKGNDNPWLIDFPIYGIRLGDNIKNIPNDYMLSDYTEGTNIVFFKTPFEDIDEISVMIDENHYIYTIGIEYNNSSIETFTKITRDFNKKFGGMEIELDETDKDDIKAIGTCAVDFDGKLIGVMARRIGESLLFPNGNVSIHYAHQDLLNHYMQEGKPSIGEGLDAVLNVFPKTDNQE